MRTGAKALTVAAAQATQFVGVTHAGLLAGEGAAVFVFHFHIL